MVDNVKSQANTSSISTTDSSNSLLITSQEVTTKEAIKYVTVTSQKSIKDQIHQKMQQAFNEQVESIDELVKLIRSGKMNRADVTLSLMAKVDIALQFTWDYLKMRDLSIERFTQYRDNILTHLKRCRDERDDPFFIFNDIEDCFSKLSMAVKLSLLSNNSFVNTGEDIFFKYIINLQKILVKGIDYFNAYPLVTECIYKSNINKK